jgi:hypothetical protein
MMARNPMDTPMSDTPDDFTPPAPDPAMLADLTQAGDLDAEGLSTMERDFAEHALDLIGKGEKFWRRRAAEMAGYKEPRGSASLLIRRPRVIAYMSRSMTEAAQDVKVDRSFVLFRALTNMTACEARDDYRTAHKYLDIIAKHADVSAFTVKPDPASSGTLNLPFDPSKLSTDDLATLIDLMRKAAGGQPSE